MIVHAGSDREHLLKNGQRPPERTRWQLPQPTDQAFLVHGAHLIENDVTDLALKPARHPEWVRVASSGKRGNNERLDVRVQFIGRHDDARPRFPDLAAACGIEAHQEDVAPAHRGRYHRQSA